MNDIDKYYKHEKIIDFVDGTAPLFQACDWGGIVIYRKLKC